MIYVLIFQIAIECFSQIKVLVNYMNYIIKMQLKLDFLDNAIFL